MISFQGYGTSTATPMLLSFNTESMWVCSAHAVQPPATLQDVTSKKHADFGHNFERLTEGFPGEAVTTLPTVQRRLTGPLCASGHHICGNGENNDMYFQPLGGWQKNKGILRKSVGAHSMCYKCSTSIYWNKSFEVKDHEYVPVVQKCLNNPTQRLHEVRLEKVKWKDMENVKITRRSARKRLPMMLGEEN